MVDMDLVFQSGLKPKQSVLQAAGADAEKAKLRPNDAVFTANCSIPL